VVELPEPTGNEAVGFSAKRSPSRRRSPKRAEAQGALHLQVGEVRSDPRLDTSLRDLTRAHWHNEPAVIGIMKHIEDGVRLVAPGEISQQACDAAFQLLQLSDNSEDRDSARAVLTDMADSGGDVVDAVLIVLHFTRALDNQTRAAVAHAMLLSPSRDTPGRLVAKVREVDAIRTCGAIMFAAAVHMSFGMSTIQPQDWDPEEGGGVDFYRMDEVLKWVVAQAEKLDAGFAESPLVEYDLGTVEALAQMVVDLDDNEETDTGSSVFGAWLESSCTEFETTLQHTRQRKSYRHACSVVMETCGGPEITWKDW
jgi:hypothetical protein